MALLTRSQSVDDILAEAEAFAEGRFPMLGICVDEPSRSFDWNLDYCTGHRYPTVPFNRVDCMGTDGGDVKYAWELSRCYWIGWLGKAFWVSSNGAWVKDFVRMVDSWREASPFNYGVNWAMPMEVGIRSFWLMMGYAFFAGAPGIDETWWEAYLSHLWDHGLYLESNLEYFSNLTNHYVANLLGLVTVGLMFSDTARGRDWLEDGRRRLIEELGHQVLPDGVHYERSLQYHNLVLEFYLAAAILLHRAGHPFPLTSLATIERMSEFVADYLPPGGGAPCLGDCDDGLLLRMRATQDIYDHRDTLAIAGAYFGRGDFRAVAGPFSQGAALLLGGEGFERYNGLVPRTRTSSILYPSGGVAILRSDRMHIVADVGPIGLHGNNDTLSFVLNVDGIPVVIDPGTYCYTRNIKARDELRRTAAHNGPALGTHEIADFDGLWRVARDEVGASVDEWLPGGLGRVTRLRASHRAYERYVPGLVVRRTWELGDARLTVTDELDVPVNQQCIVRMTLARDLHFEPLIDGGVIRGSDGTSLLQIRSHVAPIPSRCWYSPSYGVGLSTTALDFCIPSSGRMVVEYLCPPPATAE